MSATSCVLALALLSAGPGEALPPIVPAEWPALRDALYSQAVEWEILDPREERFQRYEDLAADLDLLRRRRCELANAPRLADFQRFPPRALAEENLAFNRAFRRSLEQRARLECDRASELIGALRENERLHQIWDAVRDAGCDE